jgi:hypothetical protein
MMKESGKMNAIKTLENRALIVEDFDEAVEALDTLTMVGTTRARHVALNILQQDIGDVFYQANAFEVLYDIDISDAVRYMEANASSVDLYILQSMLTCVAVDVGATENRDAVMKGVAALRHALNVRSVDDLQKIQEKRKFFEEAYPPN